MQRRNASIRNNTAINVSLLQSRAIILDNGEYYTFEKSSWLIYSLFHGLKIVNIHSFSFIKVSTDSLKQDRSIKSKNERRVRARKKNSVYLSTDLGGRLEANILVASNMAFGVHFSGLVSSKISSQFLRDGMTLKAFGICPDL